MFQSKPPGLANAAAMKRSEMTKIARRVRTRGRSTPEPRALCSALSSPLETTDVRAARSAAITHA